MTSEPNGEPAEFTFSFEGRAVEDATMPVRDLAPALLALGQAFDRANTLLNGRNASVSLDIRAINQGSFEIVLVLEQLFEQGVNFFSDDFVSSAANIKELFFPASVGGIGVGGLLALIKRLRGSKPKEVERSEDNITLEIENIRLSVPARVIDLFNDGSLRRNLEDVVKPVFKAGIDKLTISERGRPIETVEKDDLESFRTEVADDAPTTTVIPRQLLRPASVNFTKQGKWRLHDGEKTHWYSIRDADFLQGVEDGTFLFGSGDTFVCEVVLTQFFDADGELKLDYAISKVLKHSRMPQQAPLPDSDATGR